MRAARSAAAVLAFAVLAACTSPTTDTSPPPAATSASPIPIPSVAAGGAPTADQAIAALCIPPTIETGPPAQAGVTPPEIAAVERQVETARGLSYLHPVAVQAISDQTMNQKLETNFKDSYPPAFYARRTIAWRTIGVLPPGADLLTALRSFLIGEVVGFYDPETGELVYLGQGDLGLTEKMVLSHELTHAIDDQHFDLRSLDPLLTHCRDERFDAALGLVEGSAQYFSTQVLLNSTISASDLAKALAEAGASQPDTSSVPPFVQALELWPYIDGQSFVAALVDRGGTAAVDQALQHPPVSTEQVIHPDRYPSDVPVPVDIADLTPLLGRRWGDLDAMRVGEEWLRAMLQLRLDVATATTAAAGWGGGVYRAWTNGSDVVVVLRTAWDTPKDAAEFATTLDAWNAGAANASVTTDGTQVTAVFATDPSLVARATAAR